MMRNHVNSDYIDTNSVDVLNCHRLPARLTLHQVAVLLNFQPYELLLLMRLGLIKCLNSPTAGVNCRKFFSADYVQKLAADPGCNETPTATNARSSRAKMIFGAQLRFISVYRN
jgi:hypothetical protein